MVDASQLPKGQSSERTDARDVNLPGVYVHKESGAKFTTVEGDGGIVQADALMAPVWKGSWERIGDVPTRLEILAARKAQEVQDATDEALARGKEAAELKEAVKTATKEAQEAQAAVKEEQSVAVK